MLETNRRFNCPERITIVQGDNDYSKHYKTNITSPKGASGGDGKKNAYLWKALEGLYTLNRVIPYPVVLGISKAQHWGLPQQFDDFISEKIAASNCPTFLPEHYETMKRADTMHFRAGGEGDDQQGQQKAQKRLAECAQEIASRITPTVEWRLKYHDAKM